MCEFEIDIYMCREGDAGEIHSEDDFVFQVK